MNRDGESGTVGQDNMQGAKRPVEACGFRVRFRCLSVPRTRAGLRNLRQSFQYATAVKSRKRAPHATHAYLLAFVP
jgi:hypothetical protein